MTEFTIAHMYPDLMNLYGDRGNLICLKKRIEWYGYKCTIKIIRMGQSLDYSNIDMVFIGGGSDREQALVCHDLIKKKDDLMVAIESGLPMLCICGAYQLLGKAYLSHDERLLNGLGLLDFYTRGEQKRLIGNVVINSEIYGQNVSVVGFENHSGRTYFDDQRLKPFGKVIKGYGNNGEDNTEGIAYNNLIGTYLHGPLLPKNPAITDYFIKTMADRKGLTIENRLDDYIENFAQEQVKNKILKQQ